MYFNISLKLAHHIHNSGLLRKMQQKTELPAISTLYLSYKVFFLGNKEKYKYGTLVTVSCGVAFDFCVLYNLK